MNRKDRRAAQKTGRGSDIGAADQAQRLFAQALQYHQLGQFPEAERYYRSMLAIRPKHEHSLYNLGILALQTNRHELAAEMLGKAVAISGRDPEWRYNYAFALQQCGRSDQSIEQYSQAATLKPDYVEAHLNLGNLLFNLGRLPEATKCYQRIAELKPDFAETHYNLGNVLAMQGRMPEAIASFQRSIAIKPLAETHNNLGLALGADPARAEEAIAQFRMALALNPKFTKANNNIGNMHAARGELEKAAQVYGEIIQQEPKDADANENLARVLITAGQFVAAIPPLVQALQLRDTPAVRRLFASAAQQIRTGSDHPALRDLAVRALNEVWGEPGELSTLVSSLVKTGPDTAEPIARARAAWPRRLSEHELFGTAGAGPVFQDPLLAAWLESGRVIDVDVERFLTMVRALLLQQNAATDAAAATQPEVLAFWARLARHCYDNDYVFAVSDTETQAVVRLREAMAAALDTGAPIAELRLLALAAFTSLESLPQPERLLARTWSDDVQAVLRQQLREPQQERALAAAMSRLTTVTDEVSRQVQAQYEQNPYPRWLRLPPPSPTLDPRTPQSPSLALMLLPYGDGIGKDVLIAGCGTGRHVVDVAQRYPGARILAIDLSLRSLGYAARKTKEFGLKNVEYAQADILELGGIGRTFDVIETSGVLHHLRDPFAGWQVLLPLLKPAGYMHVGLYSELARRQVVAARRFIAERGYSSSADDIRRARQDLIAAGTDGLLKEVTELGDFFTVSDCRDLLFHVQEHRLTLPQIKAFLDQAGVRFLGFHLAAWQLQAYSRQFPDDKTMTNLDHWHVFETRNPSTFVSMYQFWIQRSL